MIYTVTAVSRGNSRTWGWFATKLEAELALRADNNDLIFESGTFSHAVIEEVPPGIMGGLDTGRETWWFRADYSGNGEYHVESQLNAPPDFSGIVFFGMG
jgi:hypothetical protein